MDNVEKLRIMLQHWIDHNKGHIEEFEKWQKTMTGEGRTSLAGHIGKAVELMASMNEELHQAIHEAGGHRHDDGHDHNHHHDDDDHHHDHHHGHHHHHHHD